MCRGGSSEEEKQINAKKGFAGEMAMLR